MTNNYKSLYSKQFGVFATDRHIIMQIPWCRGKKSAQLH